MATFKLTIKAGQRAQDVVKASGSAITGHDAIEVNIDAVEMSKGDVVNALDHIKQQILEHGFPQ